MGKKAEKISDAAVDDISNSESFSTLERAIIENVRQAFRPQKGANMAKKRNVLGRGLNSLMSSTMVVEKDAAQTISPAVNEAAAERMKTLSQGVEKIRLAFRDGVENSDNEINDESKVFVNTRGIDIDGEEDPETGLAYIAIDRIVPNEEQPRKHFNNDDIESLSKSIRDSGLLQPILVRKKRGEVGPLGKYEIVAGERRYRAAKLAGLSRVPTIIKQLSDQESLEIGIIENIQRSDLNPIEEARAYQRLIEDFGQIQAQIATTVGRDRASIANSLRLLKLAPEIQTMLIDGRISAGHGRALLGFDLHEDQIKVAQQILEEGLSVRSVESISREGLFSTNESSAVSDKLKQDIQTNGLPEAASLQQSDIEERLRRALGTKVKLTLKTSGKGEVRISFFSEQELDHILERIQA